MREAHFPQYNIHSLRGFPAQTPWRASEGAENQACSNKNKRNVQAAFGTTACTLSNEKPEESTAGRGKLAARGSPLQ